jgi:hypothetical protein
MYWVMEFLPSHEAAHGGKSLRSNWAGHLSARVIVTHLKVATSRKCPKYAAPAHILKLTPALLHENSFREALLHTKVMK